MRHWNFTKALEIASAMLLLIFYFFYTSWGKQWINKFINDWIIWNDNLLRQRASAAHFIIRFELKPFSTLALTVRTKTHTKTATFSIHSIFVFVRFCYRYIWYVKYIGISFVFKNNTIWEWIDPVFTRFVNENQIINAVLSSSIIRQIRNRIPKCWSWRERARLRAPSLNS